jgi:signal transduction histidine kinase
LGIPFLFCLLSLHVSAAVRVRVGVYQNSPKLAMSESGSAEGIFIDLVEAVADEEGWALEYVPGTWTECLDRLAAGDIDLMPDVAFSRQRAALYAFHEEPVLSDWFQVYARSGSGIRSVLDLAGTRVGVLERSIQQQAFEEAVVGFDMTVTVVPFADYAHAFDAAREGELDAVITNRFYGVRHLRDSGLEDTAVIFSPTRLFFAAPRSGREPLLGAIDRHLREMKTDPGSVYYQSLRSWTSDEVPLGLPTWLKVTGTGTVVLVLVGFALSVVLKRQVALRTRELRARNSEVARLYAELQHHAERLEERVRERTRDLEQANRDLTEAKNAAESADRLKSIFLATMSHELRTPLNSIIGFTGILLQKLAGPLTAEQTRQLKMVQGSSRHLLALINDVLDISKIEAGQLTVAHQPYDLRESVHQVIRTMTPTAEQHGLSLDVEIAPEVGTMLGDRRRVEQVVMNLVSNALKFTEQGGVTLRCGVEDGHVVVSVRDTGIGISPEDQSRLFRPFEQIDSGLSRKHEGTGLGLSISRRLIELMDGTISVESEPGVGSCFTFTLPLTAVPDSETRGE